MRLDEITKGVNTGVPTLWDWAGEEEPAKTRGMTSEVRRKWREYLGNLVKKVFQGGGRDQLPNAADTSRKLTTRRQIINL